MNPSEHKNIYFFLCTGIRSVFLKCFRECYMGFTRNLIKLQEIFPLNVFELADISDMEISFISLSVCKHLKGWGFLSWHEIPKKSYLNIFSFNLYSETVSLILLLLLLLYYILYSLEEYHLWYWSRNVIPLLISAQMKQMFII